jgi:hypothetical protein
MNCTQHSRGNTMQPTHSKWGWAWDLISYWLKRRLKLFQRVRKKHLFPTENERLPSSTWRWSMRIGAFRLQVPYCKGKCCCCWYVERQLRRELLRGVSSRTRAVFGNLLNTFRQLCISTSDSGRINTGRSQPGSCFPRRTWNWVILSRHCIRFRRQKRHFNITRVNTRNWHFSILGTCILGF